MRITDLDEDTLPLYLVCLEDWSEEMKEAGDHKRRWYGKMKEQGLRVKLALDDQGTVGGMIQYLPIEHSFASGADLYMILCIWVHGHKQGPGDFRGRGMGTALLRAAEEDARARGAKGIAAWGLRLPVWMRASWFRKHGYRIADRDGMRALLWKPFADNAVAPSWVRVKSEIPAIPGSVAVISYCSGWCPAQNIVVERARRAVCDPAVQGYAQFRMIDTTERENFLRSGISDALFIDGREVRTGPPPSYAHISALVRRRVKRLERAGMHASGTS